MAYITYKRGEFIPGTQYQFVRELGVGGQGVAVLAHHSFLDTEVVIKLLHADQSQHAHLQERMRDEAKALARINHPNIVHVIDGGVTAENPPRPFFVMERLHGDTLYALLRRKGSSFPVRTALTIAIELLEGLDVAHNPPHSMIHRDIKPGNIFMSRVTPHETRAILLDFGVARMMERVNPRTQRKFLGTWEYAAPEQLEGHATTRTDLYAVGLVLYEIIAGRHPFAHCKSREEYAQANMFEVPKRLSTLGEINGAVDEIVASALAKDQNQRPRTAHEFAAALKSIRHALDIEHSAHTPPVSSAKTEEEPLEKLWARMGIAQKDTATTELGQPSSPLWGSDPSDEPALRGKHTTEEQPARTAPTVKPRPAVDVQPRALPPTASLPEDPFAKEREKQHRVDIAYAKAAPRPAAGGSPSRDERVKPRKLKRQLFADKPLMALIAAAMSVALLCVAVYAKLLHRTEAAPAAQSSNTASSMSPTTPLSPPTVAVAARHDEVVRDPSPIASTVVAAVKPTVDTHVESATHTVTEPRATATASPAASAKPKRPGSGLDDPSPASSHAKPPPGYELMEKVF